MIKFCSQQHGENFHYTSETWGHPHRLPFMNMNQDELDIIYRYSYLYVILCKEKTNNELIMALYRVRTKRRKCCNGVNIEPGMEVQVVTPLNNTVQVNNWQYVEDAFMRVFGISLRKANCLNVSDLEITKL